MAAAQVAAANKVKRALQEAQVPLTQEMAEMELRVQLQELQLILLEAAEVQLTLVPVIKVKAAKVVAETDKQVH